MRIFEYLSGCLAPRNSLCEALELLPFDRNIISFVGGQGKTAAVYQLCSELSRAGVPCAAVAAEDMEIPRDYPCCTSEDPEEVRKAVQQRPFCVFGGSGGEGRLCAPVVGDRSTSLVPSAASRPLSKKSANIARLAS